MSKLFAHSTQRISEKKVNSFKDIQLENFNSIETIFFNLLKFYISFMPYCAPILKKMLED